MSFIPSAALRFGALSKNDSPISYGKSRVAQSPTMSYILHSKAGSMPGQPELFSASYLNSPGQDAPLNENQIIRAFKRQQNLKLSAPIGTKFARATPFTYQEYSPHDDATLEIVIEAAYRQIYGNFHAMESERPIDLERRLRNGDITIQEFIRNLAKSPFYKSHYFESVNQQRCIELNFKHLLGRCPNHQEEVIFHIKRIFNEGFESHIDSLIDSDEYEEVFGANTVPYPRCWNSPLGLQTSSFNNFSHMTRSFATSDNALHTRINSSEKSGGKSLLMKILAKGTSETIKIPLYSQQLINEEEEKINSQVDLEKQI